MRQSDPASLAKAAQWELAKGHLRALIAIESAIHGDNQLETGEYMSEVLSNTIETFIDKFEVQGLHE